MCIVLRIGPRPVFDLADTSGHFRNKVVTCETIDFFAIKKHAQMVACHVCVRARACARAGARACARARVCVYYVHMRFFQIY